MGTEETEGSFMTTEQLEQQTVEAITAWFRDKSVKMCASNDGLCWSPPDVYSQIGLNRFYRLAPDPLDEIAPGHNPARLTVRQVGEGWRLLEREEIVPRAEFIKEAQVWIKHEGWGQHEVRLDAPEEAYRTRKPPGYFLPKPEPARYTVEEIIQTCIDQDVWAGLSEAFRIAIQDPQHGIAAVVARKATQ